MNNELIVRNIRITFLGEDVVRVERAYRGKFSDENTFFIPDRASLGKSGRAYALEENVLCFGEYELYLPVGKTLAGLRLEKNGKPVYRYKRIRNSGELPPPQKTPEVFALADCPRILVPEGGYSAKRKGEYRIYENVEDLYLLFAGGDAKKLRRLYVELTGRCELVRLSTLGSWNSKYYPYNEEEAKQLILDYERHGVPLDNIVIDTDWRVAKSGTGYEINEELFPDMRRFLDFAHSRNVEVIFNDHPEPLGGASVFEDREIAYREEHLRALMEMGLDAWWYDRNWHTHLISPTKHVKWETFGLYLYQDVTRHFYAQRAGKGDPRRPVIMGNVVDISNGKYCGISDSASHRYSVQWTGDIDSSFCALAQEVESLIRCGENCVPYMNSDLGGHLGNPDKEQFVRWMQYGAFSPVFRPHCTLSVLRSREPWLYDGETLDIVREYLLTRYRLLPYLYANAREAYDEGLAPFRSLALEYPNDRRAVRKDEYLLGKNILIAPICAAAPVRAEDVGIEGEPTEESEKSVYLPAGKWLDVFDGKIYAGGRTVKKSYPLRTMPLFVRLGALIPLAEAAQNTKIQNFGDLTLDFYPDRAAEDSGYLYDDDGETTAYQRGVFSKRRYTARFLPDVNAFSVRLSAPEGDFSRETEGTLALKIHLLEGVKRIARVCVDGAETPFERSERGQGFPFGTGASPDAPTATVRFAAGKGEREILVFLK